MPEKHLAACPAGRGELAHAPEAEHFLIPGRARVNVTNGQPKVMNACDHALFTASMPRAASRAGLALRQAPGLHGPSYRSIISFRCRTAPQARHRADPVRLAAEEGVRSTAYGCRQAVIESSSGGPWTMRISGLSMRISVYMPTAVANPYATANVFSRWVSYDQCPLGRLRSRGYAFSE